MYKNIFSKHKPILLVASIALAMTQGATAAELLPPNEQFIEQIGSLGISRSEWDQGEYASVTFPNAYRLTRSFHIKTGANSVPAAELSQSKSQN